MALTVAWLALVIALLSAGFSGWQAFSASGVHKIESKRELDRRRPRFSGEITHVGASGQAGVSYAALQITLDTDEPLVAVQIQIAPYQGVKFRFVWGVAPFRPGEIPLAAFVYNHGNGEPVGMQPHDSDSWAIEIESEHTDVLRIEATCHGLAGERWDSVLITAKMPPDEPTVAVI